MEKMREEFEAWHIEQCKADGMDWRDLSSELDRNGDGYVYIGAQYAWAGWKASRAALCVELPSFENGSIRGYSGDCDEARMVVDSVAESLDKAGVSYK